MARKRRMTITEMARKGGKVGGRAKTKKKLAAALANLPTSKLSPEERSERARKAALARWAKRRKETKS